MTNTNLVNGGAMPTNRRSALTRDRREFIGGSDARVIMGKEEKADSNGRRNRPERRLR